MSKIFSINFDEGPIELNDCNDSISLLQKIRVCQNCGKIRFLDSEYMGLCADHKLISLQEMLEINKKTVENKTSNQIIYYLIVTYLLCAVNLLLNAISKRNHFTSDFGLVLLFLIRLCPIICILFIINQMYHLYKISKNVADDDSIYGMMIRDFSMKNVEFLGETWEDAIKLAYSNEISNLEKWAIQAKSSGDKKEWEKIYTAALELSHMADCERLALLRLCCLDNIRLLPQSYTDITQIIKIVSNKVIINWMDVVVKCFEHLCIPCDEETVIRVMNIVEYALKDPSECSDGNREKREYLLASLLKATGPYYVISQMGFYSKELVDFVLRIAQEDKLYALCMKNMN